MNLNNFKTRLKDLELSTFGNRCVVTYTRDDQVYIFQDGEATSMTPQDFEQFKQTCHLPIVDIGEHTSKEGYSCDILDDDQNVILNFLSANGGNK